MTSEDRAKQFVEWCKDKDITKSLATGIELCIDAAVADAVQEERERLHAIGNKLALAALEKEREACAACVENQTDTYLSRRELADLIRQRQTEKRSTPDISFREPHKDDVIIYFWYTTVSQFSGSCP